MKTLIRDIVLTIIIACVLFIGVQLALQQVEVQQKSMLPNLVEGERIFINKIVFSFHKPERGDIIVFRDPEPDGAIPLIKRVIGLPGETIEVKSGLVYINGSPLEEPYIRDKPRYSMEPINIPTDEYFVLGDNRNSSRDSHHGWTVPEANITGKAWLSIWPIDRLGFVPKYTYATE